MNHKSKTAALELTRIELSMLINAIMVVKLILERGDCKEAKWDSLLKKLENLLWQFDAKNGGEHNV